MHTNSSANQCSYTPHKSEVTASKRVNRRAKDLKKTFATDETKKVQDAQPTPPNPSGKMQMPEQKGARDLNKGLETTVKGASPPLAVRQPGARKVGKSAPQERAVQPRGDEGQGQPPAR